MAALEFALISPVMATMLVGTFDTARAIILWEQVDNAARAIALSASTIAIQPAGGASLTVAQAQQAMSAIYAEMPWLRSGTANGARSVTLSVITFVPSPANCTPSASNTCGPWTAEVAWSVPYNGGYSSATGVYDSTFQINQTTRSCSTPPVQIAPTASASSPMAVVRTLNITQPQPIFVADVHYAFTPLFFQFIISPVNFWATGYYPSRSVNTASGPAYQYAQYDAANQANGAGKCAGWP